MRALPGGQFEFLGRLDTQVKVRGFRIETAEIELALAEHDALRECVVIVREDQPGDRRLAAYFVSADPVPAPGQLRAFLANRLPDYMIPSAFVSLPALPRTPNGKIDRRALPAPDANDIECERVGVPPRNPCEVALARIAADVLGLKEISVEDSLFDLGADSLHIFRIVARAAEEGMQLTLKQVLELRHIAAIAADVERRGTAEPKDRGPALVAAARESYRVRRSDIAFGDASLSQGTP